MLSRRLLSSAVLVAFGVQLGCSTDSSSPLAVNRPTGIGEERGLAQQIAGVYSGNWKIEILPDSGFVGTCPGHIVIRAETLKERLEGAADSLFNGTYFIDAGGDCGMGVPVTGEVVGGAIREDGGVNFGLVVPGGDGNFFEDVLAGSGINFAQLEALGCTVVAGDTHNTMVGSLIQDRLQAVNSAGLDCVQPGVESGVSPPNRGSIKSFAMRVTIDATR